MQMMTVHLWEEVSPQSQWQVARESQQEGEQQQGSSKHGPGTSNLLILTVTCAL